MKEDAIVKIYHFSSAMAEYMPDSYTQLLKKVQCLDVLLDCFVIKRPVAFRVTFRRLVPRERRIRCYLQISSAYQLCFRLTK